MPKPFRPGAWRAGGSKCRHVLDPSKTFCLRCGKDVTATQNKFRNVKVIVDGIEFDSKKEARHYFEHVQLQRAGKISKLRRQVSYPLIVNGVLIATYIADIECEESGAVRLKDTKGDATEGKSDFVMKRKLVWALYGIKIEVLK